MRPARLALALLLVGAVACTTSDLSPSDEVHIRGVVTEDNGRPVVDRTVLVRKVLSPGELEGRWQAALSEVQLACVVDRAPGACRRAHYAHLVQTGDDGRYDVELKGRDTQTALGLEASPLHVAVSGDRGSHVTGPASSMTTFVQVRRLDLPPLQLWTAVPVVTPNDLGGTVTWTPLPAALAGSPTYRVLADDGTGGLVWDSGPLGSRTGYHLDARFLEDVDAAVSIVATSNARTDRSGLNLSFRTPSVHVKGVAGVPLSRGRPCSVTVGTTTARAVQPCPLTDGDFDHDGLVADLRAGASAEPCPVNSACPDPRGSVTVDLGESVFPTVVVIRGCRGSCAVEFSDDGLTWTPVATARDADEAMVPLRVLRGRYARVTGTTPDLGGLTELSVWPARPGQRATPTTGLSVSPGRPGEDTGRSRTVLLSVAAVLALLLAGGVGFALGKKL